MSELLSVGLDLGTTTSSLVVSRLTAQNKASSFAVPEMGITDREILYESPVVFTPLLAGELVDGEKLQNWVAEQYRVAGITPEAVDTGAVIITGETSRKENAQTVLKALSRYAGEFVVATAGPDLESVLAAKGAGTTDLPGRVLHMDIGGGTSNLALVEDGSITATFCLNVGGRLVKLEQGTVTYLSPVLTGLTDLRIGDVPTQARLERLAKTLTEALEMAAGLREMTDLFDRLTTKEVTGAWTPPKNVMLSFSGGVADCIDRQIPWDAYGDLGPILGQAIRKSRLCQGQYRLGKQTIRATVIGAGCHSTQLSGSTVFCRGVDLPVQNLPVVHAVAELTQERSVLSLPGQEMNYVQLCTLADCLASLGRKEWLIALEQDKAKSLGQALALRLPETPILCIDKVRLTPGSYLDIGKPLGPALPVVVKTLVFN